MNRRLRERLLRSGQVVNTPSNQETLLAENETDRLMRPFPDVLFTVLAQPVIFALMLIGMNLFFRGHNKPGGGFIAGLVIAVAALLSQMIRGQALFSFSPRTFVPIGLLIAALTGLMPMFWGEGFLRSGHGGLTWPFIGHFEWASAALFDLGVLFVVVGVTVSIIELLADSLRTAPNRTPRESHTDPAPNPLSNDLQGEV